MTINILWWIVLGLVIGLIVHLMDRGNARGKATATVVMGVIGSMVAGYLSANYFGEDLAILSLTAIMMAVVGGALLALLSRLIFRENKKIKIPGEGQSNE